MQLSTSTVSTDSASTSALGSGGASSITDPFFALLGGDGAKADASFTELFAEFTPPSTAAESSTEPATDEIAALMAGCFPVALPLPPQAVDAAIEVSSTSATETMSEGIDAAPNSGTTSQQTNSIIGFKGQSSSEAAQLGVARGVTAFTATTPNESDLTNRARLRMKSAQATEVSPSGERNVRADAKTAVESNSNEFTTPGLTAPILGSERVVIETAVGESLTEAAASHFETKEAGESVAQEWPEFDPVVDRSGTSPLESPAAAPSTPLRVERVWVESPRAPLSAYSALQDGGKITASRVGRENRLIVPTDARAVIAANFAAELTTTSEASDESISDSLKNFLTSEDEELTLHTPESGIAVAKPDAAMPASLLNRRDSLSDLGVSAAQLATPVSGSAELATELPPVPAPQVVDSAQRAVQAVMTAADHAAREANSVSLQFSVGGAELIVRVERRADEVQTTFRTDSPELRQALAQEWQAVQSTAAGERPVRLADPVFASNSSTSDGSSLAGRDASEQRERQARRSSEETSFSISDSSRAGPRSASALAADLADSRRTRAASLPHTAHLHTFA